jgi:hypothetical protein
MEQKYDLAVEEIKEAKNPIEKEMLLQKYGMIEPKLTVFEHSVIYFEGNPNGWEQVNFLNLTPPWEAK